MKKTILFLVLLLISSSAFCAKKKPASELGALPELGKEPVVGQWYKVTVPDAINADGSKWLSVYRKGKSKNVFILFYGGGVSVDQFTAARGLSKCQNPADMFFIDNLNLPTYSSAVTKLNKSIASPDGKNPFSDWTFIVLPYTTGDFHCGAGEFAYPDANGDKQVLHHVGYNNVVSTLKMLNPLLGDPEALVITGFSAGGFGVSLLSDDVVGFFPHTKNVTVCVDASLLIHEKWHSVAEEVWHAPEHICKRIETEQITMDCLRALHRDRPYVKILFACSAYDETLATFQTYFDDGKRRLADREALEVWHRYLKQFCNVFRHEIPEGGLFIWDDIVTNKETGATIHTIENSEEVFRDLGGHGSFVQWLYDACNDDVKSYGLELL